MNSVQFHIVLNAIVESILVLFVKLLSFLMLMELNANVQKDKQQMVKEDALIAKFPIVQTARVPSQQVVYNVFILSN